jgi:CheY-like chemotaxis protein
MSRLHLRAWLAVTLDHLPLALTTLGLALAVALWWLWPSLARDHPLSEATVVLAALCLGLALTLANTRRQLRRRYLCGGPLATHGLWICPILATGRQIEGKPPFAAREVSVYGAPPTPKAPAPPRVLVVEDDPVARHVMVQSLERAGFEVESTDDGAQALFILGHERPDVMILDLMLPTLDGPQVARTQKQLKEGFGQKTRIIVVTSNRNAQAEAQHFGADAFLVKPVEGAALVRAVAELAGSVLPAPESLP